MRQRAIIHVAGPEGAGKTTLIETVLQRVDPPVLVARCRRDDRLGEPQETSPRTEPELCRYLEKLAQARKSPASPPAKRWTVSERYAGIERAQLVIVNVRDEAERRRADDLLSDLVKLRQDKEIFSDVLAYRGNRIPITAVGANLVDPADPDLKKAIAKARRVVQSRSD